MSLVLLDTPYDPGTLDTISYTHVGLVRAQWNVGINVVHLRAAYGTESGGSLVAGKAEPMDFTIANNAETPTGFTDWEAKLATGSSEKCSEAFDRACCQWLLDKGKFAGSLV